MESDTTKRLSTWLPVDVFMAFTEFCKANAMTGLQKFDYGVGLRILLMKSQYADMMYDLDKRITNVEDSLYSKSQEVKPSIPKGYYECKTLSGTKLNMETNNG